MVICQKCGKEIADDQKFCTFCGAPVKQDAPVTPQPAVAQPVQPTVAQPVQPSPAVAAVGVTRSTPAPQYQQQQYQQPAPQYQ